jgi:hypothetical protein
LPLGLIKKKENFLKKRIGPQIECSFQCRLFCSDPSGTRLRIAFFSEKRKWAGGCGGKQGGVKTI